MNQFNFGSFFYKFINNSVSNFKGGANPNPAQTNSDMNFQLPPETQISQLSIKSSIQPQLLKTFNPSIYTELKMNHLENLERGLFIKDLMNLPKEMQEILATIQNKTETTELAKLLSKNINLNEIAQLIQQGGKEAVNKLIVAMSDAAKQGMDLSQIKETIKLIQASVSVASQDNPQQVIKTFILLYLPWLPLQEGVDFELEIESSEGGEEGSETSITILISTRNYGNVKITLVLFGVNSISVIINCCKEFPKEELLKKIKKESQNHAIQSNVTFEENISKSKVETPAQAKISMSSMTEINPFLLLMANAVIRYTIELDNLAG